MHFNELVKQRYSVRGYRPDPVPGAVLAQLLETIRLAPSAHNYQPYRLIVIRTAGREVELSKIYDRDWFVQAPLVLCAVGVPEEAWVRQDGRSFMDVDVAILVDHLTFAAADLGLGTCWIGSFNAQAARQVLGLPDEVEPLLFTPLGYPADEPHTKERRPLTDLVRYDRW